jgi:hypothetical protein
MSLPSRAVVQQDNNIQRLAVPGDGILGVSTFASLPTAAGAATILASLLAGGGVSRTGSTGASTDTLDTALAIAQAFPLMTIGEVLSIEYTVQVGFASTIAVGAGITNKGAAANLAIAANTSKKLLLTLTSKTQTTAFIAAGSVNAGQQVVTVTAATFDLLVV